MNYDPFTSIENPTLSAAADLAHFRHFRHFIRRGGFSSLFTLSPLYTCRESSTNQLLFMQNKPNLVRRRRIANSVCTRNYEIFLPLAGQKNKPNSNPIKPNLRRARMNITSFITKDYRKKGDFVVRINKPNFRKAQNGHKLICYRGLQKKNDFAVQKNKPNSNPILERMNVNFCAGQVSKHRPFGKLRAGLPATAKHHPIKLSSSAGSEECCTTCAECQEHHGSRFGNCERKLKAF